MINKKSIIALEKYSNGLSVLVVEDFKPVLDGLVAILENYFKTIDTAVNGQEAIYKYKNNMNRYDIVISDIEMPIMGGIELTKEIKKISDKQNIIIISAHKESDYLLELINLGVNRFIMKPLERDELIETLLAVTKEICGENEKDIVRFPKKIVWDKKNQNLLQNGKMIDLTKYEWIFFKLLVSDTKKIHNVDEILEYFKSHTIDFDGDNIRNLVAKLRKKLPVELIKNVYGKGYKTVKPQ
ncbi:MAG: DNA-binding response regulator [Campylobacterota bacterium]|nr:DNA-binding response regulator [Campylobacterota bacterium]